MFAQILLSRNTRREKEECPTVSNDAVYWADAGSSWRRLLASYSIIFGACVVGV